MSIHFCFAARRPLTSKIRSRKRIRRLEPRRLIRLEHRHDLPARLHDLYVLGQPRLLCRSWFFRFRLLARRYVDQTGDFDAFSAPARLLRLLLHEVEAQTAPVIIVRSKVELWLLAPVA